MNNPPKKYTKINGVVKVNPEYKRWKDAFGDAADGEACNKVTKIQLNLYAAQLKNVAGLGKVSDPFAVVTLLASTPDGEPKIIGKTEVVKNNLSPKWTASFIVEYSLGVNTRINVALFDECKKANKQKPMGSCMFEIGEILGSRGNVKAKKLKVGGTLFVRATAAAADDAGKLTLKLQGRKLKNVEGFFSKSDPFVEISSKVNSVSGMTWQPVYRSKHIDNNLNPKWEEIELNMNKLCQGDRNAPILIAVYDWEKSGRHRSMGSFETTVNALVQSVVREGQGKNVDMSKAYSLYKSGKDYGKIVVTCADITGGAPPSKPKPPPRSQPANAKPIAIPGFSGTPSARITPPSSPVPAKASMPGAVMMGQPASSGKSYASAIPMGLTAPLTPPRPPRGKSPVRGRSPPKTRMPESPKAKGRPKFVDYLTGGCELQMCLAIDFTGSNGDPRKPGTLHYIHRDGQLNDYEKAITAVGAIVARYDTDQKFPVWGFGAKFGGIINHSFRVGNKEELDGISGILEGYRQVFRTGLTMSGPTVFADVITKAAYQARQAQAERARVGKQAYHILLILSDGAVSNMELTKNALIMASDAPLSIIIVGIGSADFSTMQDLDDFLDGEDAAGRDIVQFVEFSKHQYNRESLTRETLDEVPNQVVDYFYETNGIMPLPPLSGSKFSVAESEYSEGDDPEITLDFDSPDGEIIIENPENGVYDDTQYGTLSDFVQSVPVPTSGSAPPMAPVQSVPVAAQQPQIFQVTVPMDGYSGMQLTVQNPFTQQNVMVTVPPGVSAGDTFAVA